MAASPQTPPVAPTELPTVIATKDIPLGRRRHRGHAQGRADRKIDTERKANAFTLHGARHRPGRASADHDRRPARDRRLRHLRRPASPSSTCRPAMRAMTVQVDQVSGVGTVINTGDYVDVVVGFTGDKFPVVTAQSAGRVDHRRQRPERHERQAPDRGHAGPRPAAPAAARPRTRAPRAPPPTPTAAHDVAQRPAGDRHPRGHRPAGRDHQVRPARRLDQPGPPLRARTSSTRTAIPFPPRRAARPASCSRS